MSNTKARMFNRKAMRPKGKPDKIVETLALRPGDTIADIGAGGGYFERFARFLKIQGKIVIIDYKPAGRFSFHTVFGHHVPPQQIVNEMEAAGYRLHERFDFLPEQSFQVFRPNGVKS